VKILFLTQVLPYPLDAGPKTRSHWVLRYLAGCGHRVTLLSFTRDTDRQAHLDQLKTWCDSVHTVRIYRSKIRDVWDLANTLTTRTPFLVRRDRVPEMARAVLSVCSQAGPFDAIHSDQLAMVEYALLARDTAPGRRPAVVLDQHNAVFHIPQRLGASERNPLKKCILNLEARKLFRYEKTMCRTADAVVWVSREDQTALGLAQTDIAQAVIPIAVDTGGRKPVVRNRKPRRITFLGSLQWPPNFDGVSWFAREVWPRVRAGLPGAIFTVIGNARGANLRPLRSPQIECTGYVTDPTPFLADTAVFIIPIRAGGGMRVKILDAWSWGLPVVSTTIGAEGILEAGARNMVISDDPAGFAEAVLRVATDEPFSASLARNGFQTVQSHYEWRSLYAGWADVYQKAMLRATAVHSSLEVPQRLGARLPLSSTE
jgi:polysaccharide biosynthesis protein PslH